MRTIRTAVTSLPGFRHHSSVISVLTFTEARQYFSSGHGQQPQLRFMPPSFVVTRCCHYIFAFHRRRRAAGLAQVTAVGARQPLQRQGKVSPRLAFRRPTYYFLIALLWIDIIHCFLHFIYNIVITASASVIFSFTTLFSQATAFDILRDDSTPLR